MLLKRRRTEIKEIESKPARLVAFSKRRKGLFNKAKEIGTLCGARAGIVVFSPAGKPYLFGDDVIDEFSTESGKGPEFSDVVNWVESALGGCRTVDDLESLIRDYESLQQIVEHRLKGSSTVASSGGAFLGSCPPPSPSSLLDRSGGSDCRVVGLLAAPNPILETENRPLLDMEERLPNLIDVMEGSAVTWIPSHQASRTCPTTHWTYSSDDIGGGTGTDLSPDSVGSTMTEAEVAANWAGAFLGPPSYTLLDRADSIGYRVDGLQAALNPISETDYPLLLEMEEQLLHVMPDETGSSSDNIEGGAGTGTDLSPDTAGSSMTEAEIDAWVNSLLNGN